MEGMINATDTAPGNDEIEALARAAIDRLPDAFKAEAAKVALRVEDFASDAMLSDLEIPDPFSLTGLYEGVPLTEKIGAGPTNPARRDLAFSPPNSGRMDRTGRCRLGVTCDACLRSRTCPSFRLVGRRYRFD